MNERGDRDLVALGLLVEPVRRALYEWVAAQARPVGREEAAEALAITRSLATFHLDRLADAGLLENGYRRLSGRVGPGAGRPARVYWPAAREFSVSLPDRRYEGLAHLFATALEQSGEQPVPAALQVAARESGHRLGAAERRGGPITRLTAALRTGGYRPVAEESGVIRLRNCPFNALADEHRPLVCGTNLAIAEGIVRGVGATTIRPILDCQPRHCCVAFVPDE
jgi:predicted ArsR family transcriptional regulator